VFISGSTVVVRLGLIVTDLRTVYGKLLNSGIVTGEAVAAP